MQRLAASVVLAALIGGCGGSSGPDRATTPATEPHAATPSEPDTGDAAEPNGAAKEPDYQEVELPAASNFLPLLKVGAEGIGCALVAEEADGLAYQCEEGLIFMVQKGATLRYACENAPADACGALMTRITEKMLQAAGG